MCPGIRWPAPQSLTEPHSASMTTPLRRAWVLPSIQCRQTTLQRPGLRLCSFGLFHHPASNILVIATTTTTMTQNPQGCLRLWIHKWLHIPCNNVRQHCLDQVARVVRLESAASRASGLGTLVWGKDSSGAWWPGEALDPANLPPGRALPPASLAGTQPCLCMRPIRFEQANTVIISLLFRELCSAAE